MEHMKMYARPPPPPPPPPQHFHGHGPPQHQNPPPLAPHQPQRRDFVQISNLNSAVPMSSTFANFPSYETPDFMPWGPSNGNMMAINNGGFPRHPASPPPPPQMGPPFHHQIFPPPPPPPPSGPNSYFSTNGPAGGFQPHMPNGMLSPLHSPPLGPVNHMHNNNGNGFHNMPIGYQNIPPPPPPERGSQQQQQQQQGGHLMPPRPNFMYTQNGSMQRDQISGPAYMHTPPVSAPSSPSPPPQTNGYHTKTPPPGSHGNGNMQSLSPLILSPNIVTSHNDKSSYRPTKITNSSYVPAIPRTVGSESTTNKSPSPLLAKSNLSKSVGLSSRTDSPIQMISGDESASATSASPKPRWNPDASPFMPVVKSPAIVSSTPTPPQSRPHTFSQNDIHSSSPSISSSDRDDDEKRRSLMNPAAPVFVPPTLNTPPLNAPRGPSSSGPPPNAPTGPSSMVPRTNPPPSTASPRSFSGLPLAPTGPKADRDRSIPPPPNFRLNIDVASRDLPANTPSGPRAMVNSPPTGPRSMSSTPTGPKSMTPTGPRSMTPTGPRATLSRHTSISGNKHPPQILPVVAKTKIPGIEKPVPTGPASMIGKLPPAALIPGVPTMPAKMKEELEEAMAAAAAATTTPPTESVNGGSDDGNIRPISRSNSYAAVANSYAYPSHSLSNLKKYSKRSSGHFEKDERSREGSIATITPAQTPIQAPTVAEVEVKVDEVLLEVEEENVLSVTEAIAEEAKTVVEAKEVQEKVEEVKAEDGKSTPQIELPTPMAPSLSMQCEQGSVSSSDAVIEEVQPEAEGAKALVYYPRDEDALLKVELIGQGEKTDSEADTIIATPEPEQSLNLQPPFTLKDEQEVVVQAIAKVEELQTPPVTIGATVTLLPSIEIEADDLSRKKVDLTEKYELDSPVQETTTTPSRPTTVSITTRRLSEIKREQQQDTDRIVSMKIEDGVVLVPNVPVLDTPPRPESRSSNIVSLAKKKKNKDSKKEAEEKKDEASSDDVATNFEGTGTEGIDKATSEFKPMVKPDVTSAQSSRKSKKSRKKRANKNASNAPVIPELVQMETVSALVTATAAPVTPATLAAQDVPLPALILPKSSNRRAVVVGDLLLEHKEAAVGIKGAPTSKPSSTSVEKNSEIDVGFAPELQNDSATDKEDEDQTPVHVEKKPSKVELHEKPLVKDIKKEDDKVTPLEEESTHSKANSEEGDHQDGGVKLEEPLEVIDIAGSATPVTKEIDTLSDAAVEDLSLEDSPLPPAVDEDEPDQDVKAVDEVEAVNVDKPITEVEPVEGIKPVAETQSVEVTPTVGTVEATSIEIVEARHPVEEEETEEKAEKDAKTSAMPTVLPLLSEFFEPCLTSSLEPVPSVTVIEEPDAVFDEAFLEPRRAEQTIISIDSIIEALTSCKDATSLSKSLENFSKASKPGTQEARLFEQLYHQAISSSPLPRDNDGMSTKSKRSIRSLFKRGSTYTQLVASTTSGIKAILPPFLSLSTDPTDVAATASASSAASQVARSSSTVSTKSTRPRLLPKMTMSLLNRSWSTKSRAESIKA